MFYASILVRNDENKDYQSKYNLFRQIVDWIWKGHKVYNR